MKYFPRARPAVVLASLALAFSAQYLFTGEWFTRTNDTNYRIWLPAYNVACALLVLSAAVAAIAFVQERKERLAGSAPEKTEAEKAAPLWQVLRLPALCYVASCAVFWLAGENGFVHALWLGGAVSLVAPMGLKRRAFTGSHPVLRLSRGRGWAEWLTVAVVTLAGFGLRYWRLTELPQNFHDDVSLMGWFSLDMLRHGDARWIGISGSGHVLSIHQILIGSMRLFGENQYGLVMVSVLAGTLTLPLVYLLGRETYGRWAGSAAMAMLAGSYTHIHFSRIMFGPVATFLLTAALYAFFRGWRTQRDLPFAGSGLLMGAALLTYDSARVGPVIIAALFVTSRFWKPESTTLSVSLRQWVLLGAGSMLAFGPMLAFVAQDFSAFVGRGNTVMLWTAVTWNHSLEKYGVHSAAAVIFEQIRHTVLCLHLYGDESPHFALIRPMVGAITAALFTLGAGFSLWRWRDPRNFALLMWIGLTFALGGVLTSDPPYWPHLNIALPAITLVAGMAADRVGRTVFQTDSSRRGAVVYGLILAVSFAISGAHSWRVYRAFAAHTDDPRVQSARYIRKLPEGTNVYLVDPVIGWDMFSFRFLNRHVHGKTLSPDACNSPADLPRATAPTVFIVFNDEKRRRLICDAYEGENVVPHFDVNGNVAFTSIELKVRPSVLPGGSLIPTAPWNLPGWRLLAACTLALSVYRLGQLRIASGAVATAHPQIALI